MPSSFTFDRKGAVERFLDRLEDATDLASAQGADDARELAPLGTNERKATGANPRFFSISLRTTREYKKNNRGKPLRQTNKELAQLKQLRDFSRTELAGFARASGGQFTRYAKFFRYNNGPRQGQQPDTLALRPGRGFRGGEVIKGAATSAHHVPGTLKKGIHPIETEREGTTVKGGYASEAPYSNLVEHGFHHVGGTQVKPQPFMQRSAENLRASWNSGQFFEE